jgi:hypothetical protein
MSLRKCRAHIYVDVLVIGDILLLLAAGPVAQKLSQTAQDASTCHTNMRQLGLAFLNYMQDWDELFPISWQTGPSNYADINHSYWDMQVVQYMRNESFFKCPGSTLEKYSPHQLFNPDKPKTRIVSYGLNSQLLGLKPSMTDPMRRPAQPSKPISLHRIADPGRTILLAEFSRVAPKADPPAANQPGSQASGTEIDVAYHVLGPGIHPANWDTSWGVARAAHPTDAGPTSNYLFTDAHVERLKIAQTLGRPPDMAFRTVKGTYPNNIWMLDNMPN